MLSPEVLRTLVADNPWLDGADVDAWYRSWLPRSYVARRATLDAGARVALVVGPRQAGKSTLIWHALAATGQPALFLNAEEPAIRSWLVSPTLFLADLAEAISPSPAALFFDEMQHVPEAGLFLKGLVDRRPGLPIYATGSSAFHLESKTRESLAGRAGRTLLLPFSLDELEPDADRQPLALELARRDRVRAMAILGGYPGVVANPSPRKALAELVEAHLVRDASDRFRIQKLAAFRKVLQLAASQVGNLCNYSEWATLAEISNDTVADYVFLLEETHLLKLVPPFLGGKRAEITSARKAYFLDNGVRNQVFGGFEPLADRSDAGALMENLVFSEIWKAVNPLLDAVRYWRTKSGAEVDFVVEHQGRLAAFEVKLGDARGRLSRSAHSFIDAYAPEVFCVVNAERHSDVVAGATPVRFVRPDDVAALVRAFVA